MIGYKYRAKVHRVVDGDTVDLIVDLGFYIEHYIRARLLNVDTPERGEDEFATATNMLKVLLADKTDAEGYIIISVYKTEKYGRWLISVEGVNEVLAERWPYV